MGVMIVKGEGAVLWVNLRHHIVTNGAFVAKFTELRAAIELSFGVVNGVSISLCVHGPFVIPHVLCSFHHSICLLLPVFIYIKVFPHFFLPYL